MRAGGDNRHFRGSRRGCDGTGGEAAVVVGKDLGGQRIVLVGSGVLVVFTGGEPLQQLGAAAVAVTKVVGCAAGDRRGHIARGYQSARAEKNAQQQQRRPAGKVESWIPLQFSFALGHSSIAAVGNPIVAQI